MGVTRRAALMMSLGFGALFACAEAAPMLEERDEGEAGASRVLYEPAPPTQHRWTFDADRFEAAYLPLDVDAPVLPEMSAGVVVNGGYFDRLQLPKGLVVVDGVRQSAFRPDLGGGVVTLDRGRARFVQHDAETFLPVHHDAVFAVQGYPRLVVDSEVNIARDTGRRAARTALCLREGGRVLEVWVVPAEPAEGPTLFALAHELRDAGCEDALNLDGGPSTAARWAGGHLPPRGPLPYALHFR